MYCPAATAVSRPVAGSDPRMRSRSMPAADCSLPSGFSPPPPPRSELSEAASWIAWVAERLVTLSPKRIRDITSRSEEHTSELQSLMSISYAVCCLKKETTQHTIYVY